MTKYFFNEGENKMEISYKELIKRIEQDRFYDIVSGGSMFQVRGCTSISIIDHIFKDREKILIIALKKMRVKIK